MPEFPNYMTDRRAALHILIWISFPRAQGGYKTLYGLNSQVE
jgi:hypothetical protein